MIYCRTQTIVPTILVDDNIGENDMFYLKDKASGKATWVHSSSEPTVGEHLTIAPSEVVQGPLPSGQIVTAYIPNRVMIKITADLGKQQLFILALQTFEYEKATL